MSYLVIARKYRPQVFEDVLGQDHITRTLKNAIEADRTAHAYLFSGPRGVGKTTVARILAKSLNCLKGPTTTPCNECVNCKGLNEGSSLDVFEIDGASNRGIDDIRELREGVSYMPQLGKYRIYIIDEVHMLTKEAFNALLKTLEEPPAHVKFIFATTESHKVPATINSRCQRFDFKRVAFDELAKYLKEILVKEGFTISDEALYPIIREGEGSVRDAQSLLDQVIAYTDGTDITVEDVSNALGLMDRSLIFELSRAVIEKDQPQILKTVETIFNFGFDLKTLGAELVEHVRDLSLCKVLGVHGSSNEGGAKFNMPDSEVEKLQALSELTTIDKLDMLFSIFIKGLEEIARSSTPRYSMEMMLLRATRIEDYKAIEDLIVKASELGISTGNSPQSNQAGKGKLPWQSPSRQSSDSGSGQGFIGSEVKKNIKPLEPSKIEPSQEPKLDRPPKKSPIEYTLKEDSQNEYGIANGGKTIERSTTSRLDSTKLADKKPEEKSDKSATGSEAGNRTDKYSAVLTVDGFKELVAEKMNRLVSDINNFDFSLSDDKVLTVKGTKNPMIQSRMEDLLIENYGRNHKLNYVGVENNTSGSNARRERAEVVDAKPESKKEVQAPSPSQPEPAEPSEQVAAPTQQISPEVVTKQTTDKKPQAIVNNKNGTVEKEGVLGEALKVFSESRIIEDTRRRS